MPHASAGPVRVARCATIALLLRENRRVKNAHVMFSTDKAATWSAPVELPAHLTGDRHIGAYAKDGRLVVTYRCMAKDDPWKGDWVAWVGTWEEIARLAPDASAVMPGETASKQPDARPPAARDDELQSLALYVLATYAYLSPQLLLFERFGFPAVGAFAGLASLAGAALLAWPGARVAAVEGR